ncbi:TetR/AcrR family transcriptional regulator [Williamsia sp.]|uniref:TetR/AcrR family transcriptional regulator n=1 Tax=Williamsia sp. TaxID=1872085 RepID=UPI001A1E4100|nr:TetR/AcrR family transcriptional regulator [Williamsia sp.]MBJ7287520.1 TetR/AcrR family transcriptional regulator [Williamsia sp.]
MTTASGVPDDAADPRWLRSRTRLLDAASGLLATGGIEAVTIDAVTRVSKVARTTLYRHFGSSTHLLAATFERLLPHVDPPAGDGSIRDRLIALLTQQATLIEEAPLQLTTMAWLALGPGQIDPEPADRTVLTTLRERVVTQYREPFDAILGTEEAHREIADLDVRLALTQLVGPIVFARLTGLTAITAEDCVRIVDDFLAAHTAR